MIFAALEGIGTFADDGRFAELRTVLTLFPEPLIVLVRADSEAETVADLGSARIGQGAARSRGRAFFEEVLAVHGLDPGALPGPRSLPFARQGAALCAGEIDVVALLASHPSGTVNDLAAACELRALALDETAAEAMQRAAPHLVTFRLPGGLYPGLDEPVVLIGPAVALVTTAVTPASVVERVIGTVLAHEAELRGQYPAFTGVDRAWLLGDRLAAPHHTGVRGFLEE